MNKIITLVPFLLLAFGCSNELFEANNRAEISDASNEGSADLQLLLDVLDYDGIIEIKDRANDRFRVSLINNSNHVISSDQISVFAPCCTSYEIKSFTPSKVVHGERMTIELGIAKNCSRAGFKTV